MGRSRRFGRKLAASLLEQLHRIECRSPPGVYNTVKIKIVDLIKTLIVSSPASFLLPKIWQKHESMLQAIIGAADTELYECFEAICKRNIRLQAIAGTDTDFELRVHQTVIRTLDATLSASVDMTEVTQELWGVQHNPNLLVQDCLEWSASLYSYTHGRARIYVAARLLRSLSSMGVDIEIPVINFITASANACGLDFSSFYAVVAELVRSRHFSVGRYLQWVIANGVLSQYDASEVQQSCGVGLIFALPLDDVPTHVRNLRQNLLRSVGFSTEDEKHTVAQMEAIVNKRLQSEAGISGSPTLFAHPLSAHVRESLAVKSSIGRWIRQELVGCPEPQQVIVERQSPKRGPSSRSLLQPCQDIASIRTVTGILEEVDDYTTMATVLMFCSTSYDAQILTFATVTTTLHLDIFVAIGTADQLFAQIFLQQAALEDRDSRDSLLEALIDLAKCMLNRSKEIQVLQHELQMYNSKPCVAACSPISEHMVEALQSEHAISVSVSTDEVEQLLTSGISMDKQLLGSVFGLIWKRFEATWNSSVQSSITAALPISRLCTFDLRTVNEMMMVKIEETLIVESRPKLIRVAMPLVCAKSISLEQFLARILHSLHDAETNGVHEDLIIESIELLIANKQEVDSSNDHRPTVIHAGKKDSDLSYYKAESEFFALVADISDLRLSDFPKLTQCLLSCLSRAGEDAHTAASATRIMVQIQESLARITTFLCPFGPHPVADIVEDSSSHLKLDALLRLLYIHESAFHIPNVSETTITQILVLLSLIVVHPLPALYIHISNDICDFLVTVVEHLSPAIHSRCINVLHNQHHIKDSRFDYIYGYHGSTDNKWIKFVMDASPMRKAVRQAFPIRRWETLPDATPLMTENDTSISLTLFGARKAVL
ncbi:MAG: hypothetical protein LQ348_006456 [Seirophora lacunosa]|nr:MAG: hypothetical protein LQ348_006456 [Seirophora lacunosa]